MISAEHGDRIGELEEAIIRGLDFSQVAVVEREAPPIKIAIVGKPNTGKSTLSNRLTATHSSLVSPVPGTTRDVVEGEFFYKEQSFLVLDTAGIRRKSRVEEAVEYYSVNRAVKAMEEADLVFLLIDAQEGLTDQDKKIAALAHNRGRGIILVLNKWDVMPRIKNSFEAVRDRIRYFFGQLEYAPILPVSAQEGTGIGDLLDMASRIYRQLNRRIETAPLNQALGRWLEEYPPPIGPQTRFKIKYGVQVSANPLRFIFFASRPQAVSQTYVAYLRNRLRKDLGFSQVPVLLEIRASRKSKEEARKS
jgi:GTP-binding protein